MTELNNRSVDCSFPARISNRRVHHDFVTVLCKETIQEYVPDHDSEYLQSAAKTYHSFRHGTYKFTARGFVITFCHC